MKDDIPKTVQKYLQPTWFIDSDHPKIKEYNQKHLTNKKNALEKAVTLFYLVRDNWRYNPYSLKMKRECFKASSVLKIQSSFCIPKAVLLAALAREQGIPSRLGFADVRNHLSTERFQRIMDSDIYVYHGYTELYLDHHWVKATPAFNKALCDKFGVKPLEFDGRSDSIFHEYDKEGRKHMEYVKDRGVFGDLPFDDIKTAFYEYYPKVFEMLKKDVSFEL